MSYAEVNGARLYYEQDGSGPAVLCIGGCLSNADWMRPAVAAFGAFGRVIRYDRRGYFRSQRPEPYRLADIAQLADDAAALLDALDATPAVVLGRSYGGAIAVSLALRHPAKVRALALLEGDAAGLSPAADREYRDITARIRDVVARRGTSTASEAVVRIVLGDATWDELSATDRDRLGADAPAVLAEINAELVAVTPAGLAAIDVPVLCAYAEDSTTPAARDLAERMAAALPDAELLAVPGGHLISPTEPGVVSFVERVLAG